jgi:hypothetical protein
MKINNEFRASNLAETHHTQPAQDNKENFKSLPGNLQSSISEALEQAGKAFEHVVSAVLGQNRPSQNTTVQTIKKDLEDKGKDLQSQDKLGNTQIQTLMSNYNEAQTLASSVMKKKDDTAKAVMSKI